MRYPPRLFSLVHPVLPTLATGALTILLLAGCVPLAPVGPGRAAVYVRIGPPPPPYEVVLPRPYAGAVWIPGRWIWSGRWQWRGGYWARPPYPHARWAPGRWERHGEDRWFYHRGHWHR
ncbi:hypothetical protein [Acidihalobacter prosperus]|uniref:Lipoprotein n=1 Tax=Acidihalobacter prosperus TaxID=160660 RepID=A0A1A6C167_9GAMM|nr:hypothetical protein [Acidihalobacter prosperus]OBS08293.1 lipoprotein [Acidihalobacter prosperus]